MKNLFLIFMLITTGAFAQLATQPVEVQVSGTPVSDLNPFSVYFSTADTGSATEFTLLTTNEEIGAVNESAAASDTASAGLNGRLQRIAQNISAMSLKLPLTLGAKATSLSLSVVPATSSVFPASQSGVWDIQAITTALPAGNNNIGNMDIVSIAAGDNNIGNMDIVTMPNVTIGAMAALVAGSAIIGKVGIDATTPGTTNGISVAYIGSTAVSTGNGLQSGGGTQRVAIASDNSPFFVKIDNSIPGTTNKVSIGTDGTVQCNAGTNLNTALLALESGNLATAVASLSVMDDWDESDRMKSNPIVGQAGITAGAGAVAANTPRITHASDDPVTTAIQILDNVVAQIGTTVPGFGSLVGGSDGTNLVGIAVDSAGVTLTKGSQDKSISVSFNESVVAPTAAVWYLKRQWTPPASTFFRPTRTKSVVTTAGSRTFIGVGRSLGTLNTGTNAFAATGSVASPNHYSRIIGCVTTVLSAVADNITVTYTDELGNTGNATAAVTFAASSPVGNCYEFAFTATTGQMADNGVRAVTNITDSAATTGIIEIYGMNSLHDAFGVANALEIGSFDNSAITSTETVYIMLQQAATTAQQRGATVIGSISAR